MEFLETAIRIHDEKVTALKKQIKESSNSLPTSVAGISILEKGDFETFSKEKIMAIEKGISTYEVESLAIQGALDATGTRAFVINKSFFHQLIADLNLFRKYEVHGDILIAHRPKGLVELNDKLIDLRRDLNSAKEKGLMSIFTQKKIAHDITETEQQIQNFFLNRSSDVNKKVLLMQELFPQLTSFTLSEKWMGINIKHFAGIASDYRYNESGSMSNVMEVLRSEYATNALIDQKLITLSGLLGLYNQWIAKGYNNSFFTIKISFPEPPDATKQILKVFAKNRNTEPWSRAQLCVVADVSAIGIEAINSSLSLVEPRKLDPGLVLEFDHCVAVLPDTFYYMEKSEQKLLADVQKVSEKWNPIECFTGIN